MALSVALATHDGDRWLPELLTSLADQTRLPDELVVCDDASADGTQAVLESFAVTAPFPVRRVDHDRRQGPVRAFETALGACEGDVIALADQDDRWHPDKLEVLEAASTPHDVLLAFSDATLEVTGDSRDDGGRLWVELGFSRRQRNSVVSSPPGPILRHAVASGCTMLVHRRVLDLALPFPAALDLVAEPVLHDRWLSLVAGCLGRVAPVPRPLLAYRVHDDQAVGARWQSYRQQLGTQARRSVADVRARAEARLRLLDALEDRLDGAPEPVSAGARAQLDDLGHHLRVRAGLAATRRRRVLPVAGELASGGYRRFGSGAAGALLDLLRA